MAKRKSLSDHMEARGAGESQAPHMVDTLLAADEDRVLSITVDMIDPDPDQPRAVFDPQALKSLAESIKDKGLRNPIHVRREGARYVIVEGERRWRAHKLSGLPRVRAFVDNVDAPEAYELALIENMQRENLTPIEEAAGIARLIEQKAYTQAQVAKVLGRSRVVVTKLLSINRIDTVVLAKCSTSNIEVPREQLYEIAAQNTPEKQMDLADRVLSGRLTVRETRAETKGKKPATARPITNDPIFSRIEALGKAVDKGVSQRSAREKAQIKSKIMAIIRKIEV